jgi:hypothetical protein
MQQNLPNYVPIILGLIGIVVVVWLLSKKPRKPTTDADLAALCRYFDNVNATRSFPAVQLDVTAKKGEFGLINERANLYELRAYRKSAGVSFRVAKGVYVGKRAYVSKDHLDRTATGTLILTNQRLVFVSTSKTITIQIGNIISVQAGHDCIQVHFEKRQRPLVFEFPSAQLAALLIAAFLRHPLAENLLPKEMTISATPMANHDGITLSFRDATEPQLVATR